MEVFRLRRHHGEALVEPLHERRQEVVPGFHAADLRKPKLLHQPVLQRAVRPFHAALRLAGVRAQDLDVQLCQRTSELRHALPTGSIAVHAEDRVLVGVERNRAAVVLKIALKRLEV